ncbi:MAG: lysophospholipid acyltransferase family protein [Gammaproteobacteria bacterium]
MLAFRSALFFILLIVATLVIGLPIALFGFLLPRYISNGAASLWGWVALKLMALLCGLRYDIKGSEHIPSGGRVIMSKHQSAWETIALRHILPGNQSWVLKQELLKIPVFGWSLAATKQIAIDRGAGRKALSMVVSQGSERLAAGDNVIIFPEGTRTPPGQRGKYNAGGAMLAVKAQADIVPMAHNAGVFWRGKDWKLRPGTIQVVFGPPIHPDGKKASALNAEVEEAIEAMQADLPTT